MGCERDRVLRDRNGGRSHGRRRRSDADERAAHALNERLGSCADGPDERLGTGNGERRTGNGEWLAERDDERGVGRLMQGKEKRVRRSRLTRLSFHKSGCRSPRFVIREAADQPTVSSWSTSSFPV